MIINKIEKRKGKPDYILLVLALILLAVGLAALLSASAPKALSEDGDFYTYFNKQLQAVLIGFFAGMVMYFFSYRNFKNKKFLIFLYLAMLVISILVKFIGVGKYGAVRWIQLPGFTFQPSEFVKIGMLYCIAGYISYIASKNKIKTFFHGFLIPLLLIGIMAGTIFKLQNHLSVAILIGISTIVQLFVGGVNFRYIVGLVTLAVSVIALYITKASGGDNFRADRISVWKNPFEFLRGVGWQTSQSLLAIGSGGLLGAGLGHSLQKQSYIPEPQNDFIFSIFAEETGLLGVIIVMGLFGMLVTRGIFISLHARDLFGKVLAMGITTLIAAQVILNLAVVSNTIPVTGISLPFFSYGGTSIIAIMLEVSILLNISKVSDEDKKLDELAKKSVAKYNY